MRKLFIFKSTIASVAIFVSSSSVAMKGFSDGDIGTKIKISGITSVPSVGDIRHISKLALSEDRTGVDIHKHSSTEATQQFTDKVEFLKRSIEEMENTPKKPVRRLTSRSIVFNLGEIAQMKPRAAKSGFDVSDLQKLEVAKLKPGTAKNGFDVSDLQKPEVAKLKPRAAKSGFDFAPGALFIPSSFQDFSEEKVPALSKMAEKHLLFHSGIHDSELNNLALIEVNKRLDFKGVEQQKAMCKKAIDKKITFMKKIISEHRLERFITLIKCDIKNIEQIANAVKGVKEVDNLLRFSKGVSEMILGYEKIAKGKKDGVRCRIKSALSEMILMDLRNINEYISKKIAIIEELSSKTHSSYHILSVWDKSLSRNYAKKTTSTSENDLDLTIISSNTEASNIMWEITRASAI